MQLNVKSKVLLVEVGQGSQALYNEAIKRIGKNRFFQETGSRFEMGCDGSLADANYYLTESDFNKWNEFEKKEVIAAEKGTWLWNSNLQTPCLKESEAGQREVYVSYRNKEGKCLIIGFEAFSVISNANFGKEII